MPHYIAERIITSQYKKTKLINYRQQRENANTLETCTFIDCNQYRMNYEGHIDITRLKCSLGIQYKHKSKEDFAGFISKPVARPEYCYIVGLGPNCKFIDLLFKHSVFIFIKISSFIVSLFQKLFTVRQTHSQKN